MSTKINTILVPVDFTEYSTISLDIAVQIAKRNHAKLIILNVLDFSSMTMSDAKVLFKDDFTSGSIEDRTLYLMHSLKDRMRYKYKFDIDILIKKGLVVSSIIKTAEEMKIDLIVIGTHGMGDLSSFLGSHAYSTVLRSNCPVIAIPVKREGSLFTKLAFPSKALSNNSGQYDFLESIVNEDDIVLGIPGLIKDPSKINIHVLNKKINFLGNKLVSNGIQSPEKIPDIVDLINDNMKYVEIELIKIQKEDQGDYKVDPKDQFVPVLSLIDY